jgi:uncharacterized protein (TIGR03435 family)
MQSLASHEGGSRTWAGLAIAMMLCTPLLGAQSTASEPTAHAPQSLAEMEAEGVNLSFDVASVKLNNSGGRTVANIGLLFPGATYTPTGGPFSATNEPVDSLIMFAYDLGSYPYLQIHNQLPKWATADKYDIQARAGGNPTREQMQLMMQSLLADRFKLAVHTETKEGPIYALVLAKPGKLGPQLKPDAEPCPTDAASVSATASAGAADEFPPVCGAARMQPTAPGRIRFGARETMETLAINLTGPYYVDRPVIDRTGLSGRFVLSLEYQPSGSQPSGANSQADQDGPTFLEAMREQLGLKLESATGPITVLVVDHIEEPLPN